MIKSFAHKGLEALFRTGSVKGIQPRHADRLGRMLDRLDAAGEVRDMAAPGYDLHPLKGRLAGHWAVKVSGNWRLTFRFEDGDAYIVNYQDYHWEAVMPATTRKPTHPGAILRHDYLEPLGLTVTGLAAHLGISRKHLSQVLHEKAGVTSGLALRLSRAFNTTPELWLNLQRRRDLWEAERDTPGLESVSPLPGVAGDALGPDCEVGA